uniref:Tail fiber protein n=1 Tax=Pseudomonas phage Arace01 TaxID=3138526 RepID=A0AAU6VZI3_9VIRU
MQITLNSNEVSEVVREHIQSRLGLDDASNYNVEVNEDGSITVFVDEDSNTDNSNSGSAPTGEKPARKTRRTKAQIEADLKAEADQKAQADLAASNTGVSGEAGTANTATGTVTPEVPVETGTEAAEDLNTGEAGQVGGVTGGVGSDAAPGQNDQPLVGETEASESTQTVDNTNLATNAQETEATETTEPTKARSLFANIRTPRNTA